MLSISYIYNFFSPVFIIFFKPYFTLELDIIGFKPGADFFARFVKVGTIGLNLYKAYLGAFNSEQIEGAEQVRGVVFSAGFFVYEVAFFFEHFAGFKFSAVAFLVSVHSKV